MKTTIYIIGFLILIATATAIEECDSPIEPVDIPCMVITTYEPTPPCSSHRVQIFNSSPVLLDERTLGDYGPTGRCNMTFNFTAADSYLLNFSTKDSATIIVKDENNRFFLYVVAVIILFVLIGMGYYLEDPVFAILGGILSMIMGVSIYILGFPNLTNEFLKNGIVIILIGLGFYFMIIPSIEIIESGGFAKKE